MKLTKQYIDMINKKFGLKEITKYLEKLTKLNVLVIGDAILDHYIFVTPKGRAIKDPILSVEYGEEEIYAGGVFAVANHLSDFVNNIKLITIVGDKEPKLDFINNSLKKNINIKTFTKKKSHTTVKKRYVDIYRNHKLFKIEYMNDKPISEKLTKEIVVYLNKEISKFDIVIVTDFGHGFINNEIRDVLENKSKFLSINVQSNSANMGYNYINHYKKVDFISLSEDEVRLPLMKRFEKIDTVIKEFNKDLGYKRFLVTLGKEGSILFQNKKLYKSPSLIEVVVDTVGAGDAAFSLSSLFVYAKADGKLVPFIANCAGGIKSKYMGNKESVSKEKLLNFINETLS